MSTGQLLDCRVLLGQIMRFHILSVRIGRLESIESTGAIEMENIEALRFVEQCDTLCAEIDKGNGLLEASAAVRIAV